MRCVPATINVSTFADGGAGSGSLRAAIIQANTTYQNQINTINLGSGTYKLGIAGVSENAAATGDLDITGTQTLVIQGAGASKTTIDARQLDRVFEVVGSGVNVTFRDLTITGGSIIAADGMVDYFVLHGGGILNRGGNVTVDGVTISGNELRAGAESAGGGIYSDGGTLLVKNSTVTANKVSFTTNYIPLPPGFLNGADGADGVDAPFSTSPPEPGKNGGWGESGIPGADASGGGIYSNKASVQIIDSTISANEATGGLGRTAGNGGRGGEGAINNLSGAGHALGGNGGAGGDGGKGGSATGAAVAAMGGTLVLTNVQVTNNSAKGGDGGTGGNGGVGGYYSSSPSSFDGGNGGPGGAGGTGGAAGAAVYTTGTTTLTIAGVTRIAGNTATGGHGGAGGVGASQAQGTGDAGIGGAGGDGGSVSGAGLAIGGGTAAINGAIVETNTATSGSGGVAGGGGYGFDLPFGVEFDRSLPAATGGKGGAGGTVYGAGVSIAVASASFTDTFISQNQAIAGGGGLGGVGGVGGDGNTVLVKFIPYASPGNDGGDGGQGGDGGSVAGAGVYAKGSTMTFRGVTVGNSSATAGAPGDGGAGGRGGDGGVFLTVFGATVQASGGNGGDGGSGGVSGFVRGAGVYFDAAAGSTVANTTIALNTSSTPTVTAKGGAGGFGGSGSGGSPGTAGSDWTGSATNEGAGAFLRGTVTIANATIARNSSGIAGGGSGVKLGNTIVAQNTGTDVNPSLGKFTSAGHNLIGTQTGTTGFGGNGDLLGSNPFLAPTLATSGGKTPVYGLQGASPARNAGGDPATILGSALATDQRGFPRSIGGAWDIGAVEDATNYFSIDYNFASSVAAGSSITGTVTALIGDNIGTFISDETVSYGGVNPAGQVSVTPLGLPTGWTLAGASGGFQTRANSPTPGIYTFQVKITVGSGINYGTALHFHALDSLNTGGGSTTDRTITVSYPVPTITTVNPSTINEGADATITILGTEFGFGSVVRWNGTDLATQFVNRTTLTAVVPRSLAESGSVNVTVFNPAPAGGTSNTFAYSVSTVKPTGVIPDRYIVYPGSGIVGVTGGFLTVSDPSLADTAAGLHYSFAPSPAGLVSSYVLSGTNMHYPLAISSVGTITYSARIIDKDGGFTDYVAKVSAISSNVAPVLTGANNLPTIDEDNIGNTGMLVSDLIAGKFADSDTVHGLGIAVTALTGNHGTWQFSIDGGTTWVNFGSVSDASARLLSASPTDRVRYCPDMQDGSTATMTFRAWDQTDGGTTGTTANVSTNGGSTAYSDTTATATQLVTEVNDLPNGGPVYYSMGLNGTLRFPIADLIAASNGGPPPESGQTIRLLGVKLAPGAVGGTVAIAGTNVVFHPTAGQSGTAIISYRIQDDGTTNGTLDPKQNSGGIYVTVSSVPDAGAVDDTLPTIPQGSPAFQITSSTLTANDTSSLFGVLKLTAVGNAVGGTVQLLDPPSASARIEFTPDPMFAGVAGFTYTVRDSETAAESTAVVRFVVTPPNSTIPLDGFFPGRAQWADLNADGNLDAVVGPRLYLNDGAGNFTNTDLGLPALTSLQFDDFNRDGYLDVLGITQSLNPAIFCYDPMSSTFTQVGASFNTPGMTQAEYVSWADFDGDADLDIVVSGLATDPFSGNPYRTTYFLKNSGNGNFLPTAGLADVRITTGSWADFDGDGDRDFLGSYNAGPMLFRNDGGVFLNGPTSPSSNTTGTVSTWGDIDSDGFPDFAAAGYNAQLDVYEIGLYHNNGDGTFSYLTSLGTSNKAETDLHWADVDSDGDLDFVFTRQLSHVVLVNDDGEFAPATPTDVPVIADIANTDGSLAWGDYDNNGTLDVVQPVRVLVNYGAIPTTRPDAPTGLTADSFVGNSAHLSWDAPNDDNTPTDGLTYTVRVGTTPGGNDILSAPALADGTRLVAAPGVFSQTFANVSGLVGGATYYWEVQAVDATFRGSVFSSGSFVFNHLPVVNFASVNTDEDTPVQLTANDFHITDEDAGDIVETIRIDSLPTSGVLLYQGSVVTVGQVIPFSGPSYHATNWLSYIPDANVGSFTAPAELLDFAASDGTAFGDDGTLQLFVRPVADTPTLAVSDLTLLPFTQTAFPITAASPDTDGSETVTIRITGLPANVTFNHGVLSGSEWILTPSQLTGLQILVNDEAPTSFDLTITVETEEFPGFPLGSVADTITVTVAVPTIDTISVPTSGVEGTSIGLSATAHDATDPNLTYTWTVSSVEGELNLIGANVSFTPPDNGPYTVELVVSNALGGSAHAYPQPINVANVAPVISSVGNDGPVGEGSPVTITVDASDAAGDYDPLHYTFDFDNDGFYESPSPTNVFSTAGTYPVGVRVADGDNGFTFGNTTVTVIHAAPTTPTDSNSVPDTVVEGAANGTLVGITAASTQSLGLSITYILTNDAGGRFAINPSSGVVTVANAGLLDFETATSHTITVQASDGKGGASTQDFTIAVTNANPTTPTDSNNAANSVVEGAANGTPVGITASASDVNGPTATYSLINSAGGRFAVDSSTGIVTVANASLLDFESATSHTITVQASDGKGGTSTQDFTINVTNANPTTPTDSNSAANAVLEAAPNGTAVGITANSTDPNGPAIAYSLTDNAGGRFAIDPSTGIVTVANSALLDFQVAPSHTIIVQASDGHGGTATQPFTIAVIDTHGPAVAIGSPSATTTTGGPVTFTITYTDVNFNASTLAASDITLNKTGTANGTVSVSPGSGNTRTVTISNITGDGTLGISLIAGTASDTVGNLAAAAGPSATFTVDNTKPAATIGAPSSAVTITGPITYTITYADAHFNASTLTASDITLNRTGTANGTVSVSPGSGNTRTVTISNITGDGTLGISLAAGTANDTFGNVAAVAGPSTTFSVDRTKPTLAISSPSQSAAKPGDTVTYLLTYTDLNLASVSLSASKITLNKTGTANGTVSVSGTGNTRTVTISGITGVGTLGISVGADTAVDVVGNSALGAGPSGTFTVRPASKFDMKSSSSSTASVGWNKVWQGTAYAATTGYGWVNPTGIGGSGGASVPSSMPAGTDANVLGDFAYGTTASTFRVFVGAGQSATVTIYSYGTPQLGGQGVTASVGTGPATGFRGNGTFTVSGVAGADGLLDIKFAVPPGSSMWIVNAIEVSIGR